jgi:hypothetical protein
MEDLVAARLDRVLAARLTPELDRCVEAALADPELLVGEDWDHVSRFYNPLCAAYTPVTSFDALGDGVDLEGEDVVVLTTNRVAPWMVLIYALGPRVKELPGRVGNAVIRASAVAETHDRVRVLLAHDSRRIAERAEAFLAIPNNSAGDAGEILQALPRALERALQGGTGLVTFGFSP